MFPDVKPGNTEKKLGLPLLLDLVNDFNLEQLMDKSTREKNILDLVSTDDAECQSIVIVPV